MQQSREFKKQGDRGGNYGGGFNRSNITFEDQFHPEWIEKGVNMATIKFAEKFGSFLVKNGLTTSQIRNVFGEIKRIQMKSFEVEKTSFYLLKPKMAYAAKRHEKAGINEFKRFFDLAHSVVKDNSTYGNFVDFFEAILAYHKASGGRD